VLIGRSLADAALMVWALAVAAILGFAVGFRLTGSISSSPRWCRSSPSSTPTTASTSSFSGPEETTSPASGDEGRMVRPQGPFSHRAVEGRRTSVTPFAAGGLSV